MQLTQTLTAAFITCTLALSGLMLSASTASAHEGHDHDDDHAAEITPEVKIALMEEMVKLLTEVKGLLEEKLELQGITPHTHNDTHKHSGSTLSISVEEHGGRTHVHVNETGKAEVTFFLEDLDLSEQAAIIAAIAEKIHMTAAAVKAVTTFKDDHHDEDEDGHEHGDEVHTSHAGMDGIEGIHIMPDGSVMLGTGAVVTDATITANGMIVLGDGTEVEPTADMR